MNRVDVIAQLLGSGLLTGGVFALISVGLTLIFGVMNIINFAHGDFLMLAMYLTYWMNVKAGIDPFISIIITAPLMFVIGMLVYKATLDPIIESQQLLQILMTVAIMILLQNLALMLWQADVRSVQVGYSSAAIGTENFRLSVTRIGSFIVAIATTIGLLRFLDFTWIGRAIKATSQNMTAARLMGVDTRKTFMIAFGIGIATVGIAGAALTPIYSIHPMIGAQFGTAAFVVVVLGGLGNLKGAFLGGLLIGLVDAISGFIFPVGFKEAVYLLIFILVLLIRPNGLLGKAAAGGGR